MTNAAKPAGAEGLYDPRYEHDACGVAMVARLDNRPTHEVIERAAGGAGQPRAPRRRGRRRPHGRRRRDPRPAARRASCAASAGFELPEPGRYGVAMCFLPQDPVLRAKVEELLELNVRVEGQRVLGWRDVPVDEAHIGDDGQPLAPVRQAALRRRRRGLRVDDQDAFERKLYVIRRIVELAAGPGLLRPELLLAHARLQGDADLPPAARLLPATCRTSASPARWRWCTRASRRTRSRAGSSPTRSA